MDKPIDRIKSKKLKKEGGVSINNNNIVQNIQHIYLINKDFKNNDKIQMSSNNEDQTTNVKTEAQEPFDYKLLEELKQYSKLLEENRQISREYDVIIGNLISIYSLMSR